MLPAALPPPSAANAQNASADADYDFLLVGHGIAGALLGWELRRRGCRVLVYDAPRPDSASNVAAGLMNPVAGRRFALSWRAAELLPAAAAAYRTLEAELGQRFFFATPIFKVFGSAPEQQDILARGAARPWGDFVAELTEKDPQLPGLDAPFGGAWLRGGGYVAVRELLAALAAQGQAAGWLRAETFEWAHLVSDATGVAYAPGRVRAARVVCCEGAAAAHTPYFSWLPLTPNQGEVLDVRCPGLSAAQVLNRGAYVLPLGAGQFRVGATYRWPPFATGPTPEGEAELTGRLSALTGQPFEVVGRRAGVRPAVRDRRPLLGAHPAWPWLSFCGGYGSKGVMLAPRLAVLLADWLEGSGELWPEVDLKRYYSFYK
ncbi:NAD(P)/FAD-dependent oxidoreductase [uncultured Hymenobacter sp.]|uniref:NAD(P)/FAD-dependent oxidoreductase n=1 Tax=uncultured Hymenobacter sp. TaxID=170016 RepID=UPI0035CC51BE